MPAAITMIRVLTSISAFLPAALTGLIERIRPEKQPLANILPPGNQVPSSVNILSKQNWLQAKYTFINSKKGGVMRNNTIIAGVLLLTLQDSPVVAGTIYQWSDKQGQVHFSDTAPAGAMSSASIPTPEPTLKTDTSGLRPAESELLLKIKQRSQQHAQRAQARGLQNNRKRAEQRKRCEASREKLTASMGKETYKQYSRYLRNHCW